MAARFDTGTPHAQTRASTSGGDDLPAQLVAMLPRLWAFALRLCGDRRAAERIVQRACTRTLERPRRVRSDVPPWVGLLCEMHAIWRSERHGHAMRDNRRHDTATQLRYPSIVDAVDCLPDVQRVALLLIEVEGLSYDEAACVLNVPVTTAMSHVLRARQALGAQFGPCIAR
ncbi:RNA polymerase sigma factor [Paraburkholderia sp.]|uniref:RNA polymerase sigma factor n=1 Tax=Paraburkholderia sp. TaxID=1926495 RepID=UPI003D6E0441